MRGGQPFASPRFRDEVWRRPRRARLGAGTGERVIALWSLPRRQEQKLERCLGGLKMTYRGSLSVLTDGEVGLWLAKKTS